MNDNWEVEYKNEPDNDFWIEGDVPCFASRNPMDCWCGYCGLPKNSPLYEKESDYKIKITDELLERHLDIDEIGCLNIFFSDIEDDGLCPINCLIRCHGGITFSDKFKMDDFPKEYQSFWWIGFDCSHCNDLSPERFYEKPSNLEWMLKNQTYRTLKYVKECVTKMIGDIKMIEEVLR